MPCSSYDKLILEYRGFLYSYFHPRTAARAALVTEAAAIALAPAVAAAAAAAAAVAPAAVVAAVLPPSE